MLDVAFPDPSPATAFRNRAPDAVLPTEHGDVLLASHRCNASAVSG